MTTGSGSEIGIRFRKLGNHNIWPGSCRLSRVDVRDGVLFGSPLMWIQMESRMEQVFRLRCEDGEQGPTKGLKFIS
jgi:hypothetical protein